MALKWLVQEFLNNNENVERMRDALEKEGEEFLLVRVNKDMSLTVLDIESRLPLDYSDEVLKEFLSDGYISFYGSKALALIVEELKVTPGSFLNANFEMEVIAEHIKDELLNPSFVVGELQELHPEWESFFIRPTGNTKLFSGMCVTNEEFNEWKERENHPDSPYFGQKLMISETRHIQEEYRFFVVDGKVIAGSSYQVDGERNVCVVPAPAVWEYAQKMVNRFNLSTAFVIDVAKTDKGMRVVEYNNFNTSGLYACDEVQIVRAMKSHIK